MPQLGNPTSGHLSWGPCLAQKQGPPFAGTAALSSFAARDNGQEDQTAPPHVPGDLTSMACSLFSRAMATCQGLPRFNADSQTPSCESATGPPPNLSPIPGALDPLPSPPHGRGGWTASGTRCWARCSWRGCRRSRRRRSGF